MNKLMAVVNLTPSGDPDSIIQYGEPIPEGQMDDVEASAIKADPTPCIASKAKKGYIEFKFFLLSFSHQSDCRPT